MTSHGRSKEGSDPEMSSVVVAVVIVVVVAVAMRRGQSRQKRGFFFLPLLGSVSNTIPLFRLPIPIEQKNSLLNSLIR